ncbi:MAG: N-acetyltransferase [Prevotellaceae bacterium]|jgi:predicted GNAT family acetyltransferase|nr:N-acetyltransferase [Prevotellaceae bacterium]
MEEDYELIDNEEKRRYEFRIDGKAAVIEYIRTPAGEIYFAHTEVPRELSGKGIASKLTEKAFEDVERSGFILTPLCPYTIAYLHRHPEWKRIVKKGIHF